jgi:nitroreductase
LWLIVVAFNVIISPGPVLVRPEDPMFRDLILKNRSYRRFRQDPSIPVDTLRELADLARCAASAANIQPLKYVLIADAATNAVVFDHVAWAGYLTDWPGPAEGERPTAYIVILLDTELCDSVDCDHGIAAQSILLGAVERGLGGCMIGSIRRRELMAALNIPARYRILLVLALGVPAETVVLEDATGDIKYWRDDAGIHHVPKRKLDELIIATYP